jgi:BlaI family penicillinase repressor
MATLPDLSRFELQCLKRLFSLEEASVRDLQRAFQDAPGYSTLRKIVERLEEKGAVERVGLRGRAWVYRPAVSRAGIVRKEIRRLVDSLFDGSATSLVSHLADQREISIEDLREIERQMSRELSESAPADRRRRR